MSDPRDVVDNKFDPSAADWRDEPSTLPPAPSRPYDPGSGQGIADTIDRVGIAEFLRQMERTTEADFKHRREEQAITNKRIETLANEVHDGFKMFGERIMPTLERIERVLSDHNARIVEGEQRTRDLADRVLKLERADADKATRIEALERAAARRKK